MKITTLQLGKLETRIIAQRGPTPRLAVVLCHGFGAGGTDLVPLGAELAAHDPRIAEQVQFVFPAAPLSLAHLGMPGARAWWPLDLARIEALRAKGQARDLSMETPDGLALARRQLRISLEALYQRSGLGPGQVVLGGFSQGAMLCTDTTLRAEEAPAGLCILSGTLLCASEWQRLAPMRQGLRVFQSHGRQDPLLPFELAQTLHRLLDDAGLETRMQTFDGEHTIPNEVVRTLAHFIASLLP